MNRTLLNCQDLSVTYTNGIQAVRRVSFTLDAGEVLALVGESGCGKTTIARAILGLLPASAQLCGSIRLEGVELVGADEHLLQRVRGRQIGFVVQDPFEACNPLTTIFAHVAEAWRAHGARPRFVTIAERLTQLNIVGAAQTMQQYPHQWSGGMLQRATIAAAAAHQPPLLIADEPTSALDADRADVTLQALKASGAALLVVSHDIGVVARHADRIAVCYAGQIVEIGATQQVLNQPRHPYTVGLLSALPRDAGTLPKPLPGAPPLLIGPLTGCAFAKRCRHVRDSCHQVTPPLVDGVACPVMATASAIVHPADAGGTRPATNLPVAAFDVWDVEHWQVEPSQEPLPNPAVRHLVGKRALPVAEMVAVSKSYGRGPGAVQAVAQVDLQVRPGEIVGISGPSGCGKSTLLRLLGTVEAPSHGALYLAQQLVAQGGKGVLQRPPGGFVMPIFQDPVGSLDRRWPIWRTIVEPLTAPHRPPLPIATRRSLAQARLAEVGLANLDPEARPGELSVGQCQRIAIARALAAEPALLIADEPTSALDASVSAAVLHLLAAVARRGTAIVIVSHDQALLTSLCDRVLTMANGRLGTDHSPSQSDSNQTNQIS